MLGQEGEIKKFESWPQEGTAGHLSFYLIFNLKKGTPSFDIGKLDTWAHTHFIFPSFHKAEISIMDRGRMNTSTLDRVSRLASTAGDKESIDVSLAAIEWDIKLVDGGA